jgi:phytanoyl-CoA hydroxylase
MVTSTFRETSLVLNDDELAKFECAGFVVLRGLFSREETAMLRDHFMALHQQALRPDSPLREHYQPQTLEAAGGDVLRHYPRIMQPHLFDGTTMSLMLDRRFENVLRELLGEEPLAAQSMLYFKPPGGRGQARHQDNFFLKVKPGTCVAAWIALDDADSENGTLSMVPGSHRTGVLCPHAADLTQSFTTEEVDVPAGMTTERIDLKAGDVMFFNGGVIHGSHPNASQNRFRRSLIYHYVPISTQEMNGGLYPLHTFAGEKVERGHASGGPCGTEDWMAFRSNVETQLRDKNFGETDGEYVRIGEYFMFGSRGASAADRAAHAAARAAAPDHLATIRERGQATRSFGRRALKFVFKRLKTLFIRFRASDSI